MIGLPFLFVSPVKLDPLANLKKLLNKFDAKRASSPKEKTNIANERVMSNNPISPQPYFLAFGKNLIKEILPNENEFCTRDDIVDLPIKDHFVFKSGEDAMKVRT